VEDVNYEVWDTSRPNEEPYTRKSYMFVAWVTEDKIDEAKNKIGSVEENYQLKLTKLREKIKDAKDFSVLEEFDLNK